MQQSSPLPSATSSISPTAIRNYRQRYYELGINRPWWFINPHRVPPQAIEVKVHKSTRTPEHRGWIVQSIINALPSGDVVNYTVITERGACLHLDRESFSAP